VPVFILDPKLLDSEWNSERRFGFLFASLQVLAGSIQERGGRLIFRLGEPEVVLKELVRDAGAERVFAERDISPYARYRDERVARVVPLTLTPGLMFHQPEEVLKPDGSPYTIFTPYSRAWQKVTIPVKIIPTPDHIPGVDNISSDPIPQEPEHTLASIFPAGEREGVDRLEVFTSSAIENYHEHRDRMDLDGTSSLSPYLRFGMVSIRQVISATNKAIARFGMEGSSLGAETWLNEITWREFYQSILYHFPHVRKRSFREKLIHIQWRKMRKNIIAGRMAQQVTQWWMQACAN